MFFSDSKHFPRLTQRDVRGFTRVLRGRVPSLVAGSFCALRLRHTWTRACVRTRLAAVTGAASGENSGPASRSWFTFLGCVPGVGSPGVTAVLSGAVFQRAAPACTPAGHAGPFLHAVLASAVAAVVTAALPQVRLPSVAGALPFPDRWPVRCPRAVWGCLGNCLSRTSAQVCLFVRCCFLLT